MKFSEMLYTRPDVQELRAQLAALTKRLKEAADYAAAKEVFLEKENWEKVSRRRLRLPISGMTSIPGIRSTMRK